MPDRLRSAKPRSWLWRKPKTTDRRLRCNAWSWLFVVLLLVLVLAHKDKDKDTPISVRKSKKEPGKCRALFCWINVHVRKAKDA